MIKNLKDINQDTAKKEDQYNKVVAPLDMVKQYLNEYCKEQLQELSNPENNEFIVDFNEFEYYGRSNLADDLIKNSEYVTGLIKKAVSDVITDPKADLSNLKVRYINIDNTPLKEILANKLGQLISTKGIIKGIGEIKPVIETAAFECKGCMRIYYVPQSLKPGSKLITPGLCNNCGKNKGFRLIEDENVIIDARDIIIEEATEDTSTQTRRRMIVRVTDNDLRASNSLMYRVDTGNRVNIIGIPAHMSKKDNNYNYYIHANNIIDLEDEKITLNQKDIKKIKEAAKDPTIIETLKNSIAPELILNKSIKLSILCYLVKGITTKDIIKINDNLDIDRDYLHINIIADPSTAKSKLANNTINLAEKGTVINGANTTGPGLTGAVVKDPITGQAYIEVGAIPLYHKGHLAIDEFDKMPLEEQKKLLRYMEEGTDSIHKGGLHETFYGRTSILTLSNPKYGRFDRYKDYNKQVMIYSPLLSRFDLTFIIEDTPDTEKDKLIAKSILNLGDKDASDKDNIFDPKFLQKYIKYASNLKPVMTEAAKQNLLNYYIKLRGINEDGKSIINIDTRSLQSLIRISGAIAKLRLSNEVTVLDTELAIEVKNDSLKSVAMDPETGNIDFDVAAGRTGSQDKKNVKKIIEAIEELLNIDELTDYEGRPYVDKNQLMAYVEKTKDIKERTFYKIFKLMLKAGDVTQSSGYNKKVYLVNND